MKKLFNFLCSCRLGLATKLNFNISKAVFLSAILLLLEISYSRSKSAFGKARILVAGKCWDGKGGGGQLTDRENFILGKSGADIWIRRK